jgi:L-asparaginase
VAVAAAPAAHGLGALVVLNDEVHAARFVRKGHTGLPSAFTSAPHGPVGHVIEGRYLPAMRPLRVPLAPLAPVVEAPPVALLLAGLGDDGRLITALPALGFRGAVVAATGAGHVPKAWVEPLAELALAMPVVLSTRVAGGPVFAETYGFPGSERDLLARGLFGGGMLGPVKARLLLQLALASGCTGEALSRLFTDASGGGVGAVSP